MTWEGDQLSMEEQREKSYHVNMLVNLLLKYPEIYTITFNIPASSCRLSYMVKGQIGQDECRELQQKLQEYLEAFYFFSLGEEPCRFKLLRNSYPGLTQIQLCIRGQFPLDGVISLFTHVVREHFSNGLITEFRRECEASFLAGELSDQSTPAVPNRKVSRLFAFREAGRVYVFDK